MKGTTCQPWTKANKKDQNCRAVKSIDGDNCIACKSGYYFSGAWCVKGEWPAAAGAVAKGGATATGGAKPADPPKDEDKPKKAAFLNMFTAGLVLVIAAAFN